MNLQSDLMYMFGKVRYYYRESKIFGIYIKTTGLLHACNYELIDGLENKVTISHLFLLKNTNNDFTFKHYYCL